MTTDLIATYVDHRNFGELFIEELGWSRPNGRPRRIDVPIDTGNVTVEEVATLKGVTVWACPSVPDGRTQREIDRHLKRESTERLTIFHDDTHQQWKWPQTRDTSGAGAVRLITHEHRTGRPNQALAQRLEMIALGVDDDDPTVVEINRRLRRAFDADAVTKKFYRSFSEHHSRLCDAIEGIVVTTNDPAQSELRWYASLLMNRLMFIYFMQRKGFLDNDRDYLRNRLERLQAMEQPGSFYEFYKDFLLPLFHQGLGADASARDALDEAIQDLIGDVPYVNGGIFAEHAIEKNNQIAVPDEVFAHIFDFFDSWQWHLDDRPTGNPDEINPDVLGYIFEQFINQKQQGAYYTKEDVTGYMTENTLIPVFLERLEAQTGVNPWRLLAAQPDRYIWNSLRHGEATPLPDEIAAQADTWPRPTWDESVPNESLALPGETWWETVDRRKHVEHLRTDLAAGNVRSAADLVSANLDLATLAVDTIDAIDNPADVASAWQILTNLRVIDPTCGSGAFLFAALNTLHALYAAVIDSARTHHQTKPTPELDVLLTSANAHRSLDYYLLKHAALSNIYGVDLMPEAVEIARLRLFLKLISQIDNRRDIEPLPDLEFNIKPGNILVGALNENQIRDRADLTNLERVDGLVELASEASASYRAFAVAQEIGDDQGAKQTREHLGATIQEVRSVLNGWWHQAATPNTDLDAYLDVHRPFHWFIEFPEVFEAGGFDVVVGNPPYLQRGKIPYFFDGFQTKDAPDIYAPCTERASEICRPDGRLAMIVMHSLQFSRDFKALRSYLRHRFEVVHAATFSRRPSTIFNGAGVRSTIVLGGPGRQSAVFTTDTRRWLPAYRPHLMASLRYTDASPLIPNAEGGWPRTGDAEVLALLVALQEVPGSLGEVVARRGSHVLGYKQTALYYLSAYIDEPPAYDAKLNPIKQPKVGALKFASVVDRDIASVLLTGRLELLWWASVGDDFDVTPGVLATFPVSPARLGSETREELQRVAARLREAAPTAPLYTLYAKKWLGNYDFRQLRHITDEADELLLDALGLSDHRATLRRVDARLFKSSGDAGNSIRTWPPPER